MNGPYADDSEKLASTIYFHSGSTIRSIFARWKEMKSLPLSSRRG